MLIVEIIGGTASQMSAFMKGYIVSKRLGKELVLDVSDYINGYKFPYALDYFDINYRKLQYMHASPYVLSEKIVPKEFLEEYHPYFINTSEKTLEEICTEAEQHKEKNIYLMGETYISPYEMPEINQIFKAKENEYLKYFKERIKNVVSVAVHVRRTDFIPLGCSNEYAYYKAAIHYVEERIPNAVFFLFSDDLDDVKRALGTEENYRYVKLPGGFATDVVEMLCMSMCNHRIMTGKSGYSVWAAALSMNKEGLNIVFSEEKNDKYINLDKAAVIKYLDKEKKNRKVLRQFDWNEDEDYIVAAIDEEQNIDKAMQRICEISFDCADLSAEQFDKIYLYYENILFEKENYIWAEQALLKHLELTPNSAEANFNMAVVKRLLGKNMAAYLFASRACREALDQTYTEFFVKTFYEDKEFDYFKRLCVTPKMHFIICPVSRAHFYKKHSFSLAILLKLLGHEVSMLNSAGSRINCSAETTEKQIVDSCIKNAFEIDASYHHNVNIYPYAEVEGMDIYSGVISRLAESTTLPTVVVGRSFAAFSVAGKYPVLYWDFSEDKDLDSQLMKQNLNWEKADCIMKNKASVILTTRAGYHEADSRKMKCLDFYVDQKAYWFDEEKFFGANYIDDERFLKFVYDMLDIAAECVSAN